MRRYPFSPIWRSPWELRAIRGGPGPRLRPGLKYEDGRPITAQDVKYGVMRSFNHEVFSSGATWMADLANDTGFESPYATSPKRI